MGSFQTGRRSRLKSAIPAESTQYDRRDAVIGQSTQALLERWLQVLWIARPKQGRVLARHFFGRTAIAEVIQRQGFSGHAFGALQRIRMSMVREVRRAENHYAVENRQYFGLALFHVTIPKLQFSAVFLAPILVEIEQQIQTPIQTVVGMAVEVRVHAQLASAQDLMQST